MDDPRRIALHEAAHACIAHRLGVYVVSVRLGRDGERPSTQFASDGGPDLDQVDERPRPAKRSECVSNLTPVPDKNGLGDRLANEVLVMLQPHSRAIEAHRTANAAVHPGTRSEFLSLQAPRSKAEFLALESRWSFLERLYALPLASAPTVQAQAS